MDISQLETIVKDICEHKTDSSFIGEATSREKQKLLDEVKHGVMALKRETDELEIHVQQTHSKCAQKKNENAKMMKQVDALQKENKRLGAEIDDMRAQLLQRESRIYEIKTRRDSTQRKVIDQLKSGLLSADLP